MRAMKSRSRQPKGVRKKSCQRSWTNCFNVLGGYYDVHDLLGGFCDVFFFDEVQENSSQRRFADSLADFAGCAVSDNLAFPQHDQVRTDFFHHFQNMRAVENGFAAGAQGLNEILDDERGSDVEAGERLVEDEQV